MEQGKEMQKEKFEESRHYDAFISYCHCERDMAVAKKLHRILEDYKVPERVAKETGKKKISRIFRDREELSVSADLSSRIQEALECSDYLIVICSPESKESKWVQNEVEFFLDHHDVRDVLCLLTEGEPEDVFPEMLRHRKKTVIRDGHAVEEEVELEPLAADVRADSASGRMKKLKEESLRILAAMIGCSYDDLKQRQREQKLKRTMWLALLVAAVTSAFMAYAFVQNRRITAQYDRTLQEQAKYFSRMALEELDSGHRERALQLSLAAESKRHPDQPLVEEQLYPLNRALGTYSQGENYLPAFTSEGGKIAEGRLSAGGDYYIGLDKYSKPLVLDGTNGKVHWQFSDQELADLKSDRFCHVIPTKEEQALLFTEGDMLLVDLENRKILYHVREDFYSADRLTAFCPSKDRLCYLKSEMNGNCSLNLFDIKTGQKTDRQYLQWTDKSEEKASLQELAFDDRGDLLYITLILYSDKNETESVRELAVYDLKKEKILQRIQNLDTERILPLSGGLLACIHTKSAGQGLEDVWERRPKQIWLSVRDSSLKEISRSKESVRSAECGLYSDRLNYNEKEREVLYAWIGNRLIVWDVKEGKGLEDLSFNNQIIAVCSSGNRGGCFVAMNSGYVMWVGMQKNISRRRICDNKGAIDSFEYNRKHDLFIQKSGNDIIFNSRLKDNEVREVPIGKKEYVIDMETVDVGQTSFQYIMTRNLENGKRTLKVYKGGSKEEIYSFAAREGMEISHIQFGEKDGKALLAFVEKKEYSGDRERASLYKISIPGGETLLHADLGVYETLNFYEAVYDPSLDMAAFLRSQGGVACMDISGKEAKPLVPAVFPMKKLDDLYISRDGRYLVGVESEYEGKLKISIYDRQEETYLPRQIRLARCVSPYRILPGTKTDLLAVYDGMNKIYIYRCKDGKKVHEIEVESYESGECSFAFLDDDQYMITASRYSVSLWDLDREECVMSWNDASAQSKQVKTGDDASCFGIYYDVWSEQEEQDTGFTSPSYVLFSLDEQHHFTPVFEVEEGLYSFRSREVFWQNGDRIVFRPRYEFGELKTMALEILDGRSLSEAEKRGYFTDQNN